MLVKEIMNKNIYSIDSSQTIHEALHEMYNHGVERLFIFDKKENPIGVISYKDILLLVGSDETMLDINIVKVSDIMTENVNTIDANDSIQDASNLMLRAEISGLLVTEHEKNVGVITKTDICRIVSISTIIPK
ncbi:cyclic nucleotide-binding/CBS domain-containing protein [Methanosphaera sp. WGK6]|uniref:CBS domain-containing protein n=1 Tax=Methanosphaera sp. WGK6 TaxID=1561964 RepID=UPI00084C522B|nr:CBS domain-containing protein [Methanosphaera sp. WGK6]OED30704.1 histidine kinase [Methanosphaera sp. WGK6]